MSQHFLLSRAARTLSLASVARMTEEEARETFKRLRWSENDGEPFCPRCGCADPYEYRTRQLWKCRGCGYQFSVTAMTIFASRKLPLRVYLFAVAIFTNGVKGYCALQLSRDLNVQFKTAFVLLHKIREAVGEDARGRKVGGPGKHVEVDGAAFGGYVKPANYKKNRRDRRKARNQSGKRQWVVVLRERSGRTLPFVFRTEDASIQTIRNVVSEGTTLYADEASHWDQLHAHFETRRINHSDAYSSVDACTNWVESFHSRGRRAEIGIHHHVAGPYLVGYAREMAWREDNRQISNGQQYLAIVTAAAKHPVSTQWCGYWQRGKAA